MLEKKSGKFVGVLEMLGNIKSKRLIIQFQHLIGFQDQ